MESEDERNESAILSQSESFMATTSSWPAANNDNDGQEYQQTSLTLSNSFYSGMDSLNILSSQENDISPQENDLLMSAGPIHKKRTFDSLLEETSVESQVISHDSHAPVSKKINARPISAENQAENTIVKLSSYSFKSLKRKPRKIMYKITNNNEITSSCNKKKKVRHDFSVKASQSLSSQKSMIVASEPSKPTRGRKKKLTRDTVSFKNIEPSLKIFFNIKVFFIPNNIDKVRLKLMKEKIVERGGQVVDGEFNASSVTHVITALQGRKILNCLGIHDNDIIKEVIIVDPNWISECLMYGKLADVKSHIVHTSDITKIQQTDKKSNNEENKRNDYFITRKPRQDSMSPNRQSSSPPFISALASPPTQNISCAFSGDDPLLEMIAETKCLVDEGFLLDDDDDDDDESQNMQSEMSDSENEMTESSSQNKMNLSQPHNINSESSPKEVKSFKEHFTCMHKHTYGENDTNPNKLIIDKLKVLLDHYQRMNDEWRTLSYRKAISAIKRQKGPITSYQEAIEIRGIGHRTAEKIAEIVNTGNLRRVQNFSKDEEIIKKFSDIWGVGSAIAMKWFAKGYRTFDDILQNVKLSRVQRIGIECFDDLRERIPRDEVTEISKRVEEAACKIDPRLLCITVGSYIRGLPTSGDIDILITRNNSDGKTNSGHFLKLLNQLREQELLTHDLTQLNEENNTSRYFGICKLPGGKYRRIDFFVVPFNELGAALLSYTGNDVFNRSIRLFARKQKMKLNSHGLYKNISRGRGCDTLNEGTLIAQRTEREIFDALGVPWRPPSERNC